MKLLALFFLLVSVSLISFTLSNSVHIKTHNKINLTKPADQNKWAQLFYGTLLGMTGKRNKIDGLSTCLPKKWQVVNTTNSSRKVKLIPSKVEKRLNKLSKIVKFICKFKKQIKKLFRKRISLYNRKLFIQKMDNYQRKWTIERFEKEIKKITQNAEAGIKKVVNDASKGVKKVAKRASKGVSKVAKNAAKGIKGIAKNTKRSIENAAKRIGKVNLLGFEDVEALLKKSWKDVMHLGRRAARIIKKLFKMVKPKLQAIVKKKWVKLFFKKVIPCSKKLKGTAQQVYIVLNKIYRKMTLVMSSGYAGLGRVFINLVCNFDRFREAIQSLVKGMKEKSTPKKYYLYGQFFGTLLRALRKKKLLNLHFFLMNY